MINQLNTERVKNKLKELRVNRGTLFFRVPADLPVPEVSVYGSVCLVPEFEIKITTTGSEVDVINILYAAEKALWSNVRGVVTYRHKFWQTMDKKTWVARVSVTDLNCLYMVAPNKWSTETAPLKDSYENHANQT